MGRSDKVKPGESKFGVLLRSLLGARIGTTVQVARGTVHAHGLSWVAYEIIIPGVGVYTLPSKNSLPRYVEVLE